MPNCCQQWEQSAAGSNWYKALLRPAHSLAALPSAARRCTATPRSSRAGRGARPATSHPPHMLCPILPARPKRPRAGRMGQSAPAPGSLARSPPIRGAQVHLDAQVLPRRSRCAPCNIPPAAHACPIPNVLTRGAAARNEPSPGTEAFDPALARLARGYPHEGHHAQPAAT